MSKISRQMWFGNQNFMTWISCPLVDRPSTRQGFSASGTYANGGSWVKRSLSGAKHFEMEWPLMSRDEARKITDFHDGVYGPGPFYWIDPMVADKNVLPQNWATPSLAAYDGVPLTVNLTRPTAVPTPDNTRGFPPETARYALNQTLVQVTTANRRLAIPVPPGHTLRIRAFGVADGTVRARISRRNEGNSTVLVMNAVTAEPAISSIVDGGATGNFGYLSVDGTGTLDITAFQAIIYPTNKPVLTWTNFVSGQGHSGCEFEDFEQDDYSARMDKVRISAELKEVGQWL